MKLLITGGSGFIGSHLVDHLIDLGHEVSNIDIVTPRLNQKCRYINGNILNLEDMLQASKGIDAIFHLAAEAKVGDFFNAPVASSENNILGTVKVFEAARKNKPGYPSLNQSWSRLK